jgi:polar amino acid transport system substrate-binding protein
MLERENLPKAGNAMRTSSKLVVTTLFAFLLMGCAAVQSVPSPQENQALAPTGKLRVCLYLGGPTNAVKDPVSGEIKGVGFDLGEALARRMKIPYEPVIRPTPRAVVEAITSGGCDVTFIAQDPDREKIMDFTAVYMNIEHGFLVPSGSPISTMAEVDRPGIRVGVPAGGSVIPPLKRTLRNAELVGSSIAGAVELLRSGQVDVFAANKANLFEISDKLPGSRVLEGRFSVDRFALGVPKGRDAGLVYVRKFIEDAKSEGLVDAAIKRAGVRGTIKE